LVKRKCIKIYIYTELHSKEKYARQYHWSLIEPFSFKSLKNLIKWNGKSNKQIAEEISVFTRKVKVDNGILCQDTPEFYAYYADYDWVLFCSLFGRMIDLPKGFPMYCIDLKQELDRKVNNLSHKVEYFKKDRRMVFSDDFSDLNFADGFITKTVDLSKITFKEKLEIVKNYYNDYPKQKNEHNALANAKWNYELFKFLKTI
jgi:hypothetical protein